MCDYLVCKWQKVSQDPLSNDVTKRASSIFSEYGKWSSINIFLIKQELNVICHNNKLRQKAYFLEVNHVTWLLVISQAILFQFKRANETHIVTRLHGYRQGNKPKVATNPAVRLILSHKYAQCCQLVKKISYA